MIKILSWNVNGIRACIKKNFFEWFYAQNIDILCLQEIKAHPEQLSPECLKPEGYETVWYPAEKKGYSGVACWFRDKPLEVTQGLGEKRFDQEGRTLILEYEKFYLINCYFPNGQRDHARVPFKLDYCQRIEELTQGLNPSKEVIICGDFNTAHQAIDLRNPKQNQNTTGFLPQERQWMDQFISRGFIDIFRQKNPGPHHYTWWSYRPTVRQRNIGWRIDYFFISPGLENRIEKAYHQPQVMGSDHCPIGLELHA